MEAGSLIMTTQLVELTNETAMKVFTADNGLD